MVQHECKPVCGYVLLNKQTPVAFLNTRVGEWRCLQP